MAPFRLGKTENEKIMERRSRLSRWKSEIDRAIRSYERNRERNMENVRVAMGDGNEQKARVFASNILMLDSAIRGLKDYKLFLDNIDLNLQFAKTTKDIWASLKEGSQDLIKSQLSDKQMNQISANIDSIMVSSEQIQDRLNTQLDQITSSVDQIGQKNPEQVGDILKNVRERIGANAQNGGSPQASGADGDKKDIDDLINQIKRDEKESN